MPRYRFRFTKLGDLKFISHLDTSHVIERAARRADLPLAFSQGFHPHPKIAFATALSVGTTSEAEYFDIDLLSTIDVKDVQARLNAGLPQGMVVIDGRTISDNSKSLMATVRVALYIVVVSFSGKMSGEWEEICQKLLSETELVVRKKTKSGIRDMDIRPLIKSLTVQLDRPNRGDVPSDSVYLSMLLATGSDGMAKPEDIVAAAVKDGIVNPETRVYSSHRLGLFADDLGQQDLMEALP